jgi:hypothetical protein
MAELLTLLLGAGRGEDPDGGAGILLIGGIILLAVLTIATILFLVTRATSRRGRSPGAEG